MAKGKRQYGTGSVVKLKNSDGSESRYWYVLYRVDGRQVRESSKSESKMEAEKLLQKRMGEAGMGRKPTNVKALKYEDIREAWLQEAKNRQRGTLYTTRAGTTTASGLPRLDAYFKSMKVTSIDTDCLRRYIAARKKDGAADPTIRRNLVILRSMLNMARKEGKLELHQVPWFPMPQDSDAAGQYVSPEAFEKILGHLPETLHPFFQFLYATSCRIGAAKKITWAMLNEKRDVISLPGPIVKNRKPLTVVLDGPRLQPVAAMLRKMFAKGDQPIFDYTNYRVAWQKACHKTGHGTRDEKRRFSGLRIHDLRVSGAVNMIEAGIPEDTVMKIGGWKTRAMFSRYNVHDVTRIREAMVKAGQHVQRQARAV
jgi:integrase